MAGGTGWYACLCVLAVAKHRYEYEPVPPAGLQFRMAGGWHRLGIPNL
jgi:hypothetical protein